MDPKLIEFIRLLEESKFKGFIDKPLNLESIDIEFHSLYFIDSINFVRQHLGREIKIYIKNKVDFTTNHQFVVKFSNCIFNEKVILKNCIFNSIVEFKNTVFKKQASFEGTFFESKVRFHHTIFEGTADFNNTKFKELVDFYYAEFKQVQQFHLTDFMDITIFSNVIFHKQVQFLHNKISSETTISFEEAAFKQALDISRSNFWCKIQFWGIKIENIIPTELWLYAEDDIEGDEPENKKKALSKIRESYRRIKNEFREEGNNIEALKFHQYEMEIYNKEVNIKEENVSFQDKLILYLNKCSNNFGSSWGRGFVFTLIGAFFFYLLFLDILFVQGKIVFSGSCESISETCEYFLQFLNVAQWEDYNPFGIKKFGYAYFILFIGRIFIGYGYYQTIQAFRKYGKN